MDFTHLHVHSAYSLLDGAGRIQDLVQKAKAQGGVSKNFHFFILFRRFPPSLNAS